MSPSPRFHRGSVVLLAAVLLSISPTARADRNAPLPGPSAATAEGVAAYDRGDIATAYRLLRAEADRGDSDAEVNLGYLYARGQGVAMNQLEALRLYTLSAEQGNGEGMNALGYKYQFGTGVAVDINKAVIWYCAAITRGNPRAMNNLAIMLDQGKAMPRNLAGARDLWQQAIDHGDVNSMVNLGLSLIQSPVQPTDRQHGTQLIYNAANRGQINAEQILRQSGYAGPLPAPIDYTGRMVLQPRNASPGHADICGESIS